jgi:N-acetyl sugar amidotransferase
MDNVNDPYIEFDAQGVCSYCKEYQEKARLLRCTMDINDTQNFDAAIKTLKQAGKGKPYDCIIGLSGGVDSTYVAYLLKKNGVRPLAIHLDNGWNSELAVKNIELVVNKLDIPLHTYVIDWEEFKDIQGAFLKASLANLEAPTDHAINATLFKMAKKYGVKHIVSGGNIATESILPKNWGSDGRDLRHIKSVHRRFGSKKMQTFPTMTLLNMFSYLFIEKIRYIFLLNFIPYNKAEAVKILESNIGWQPYGGKHYESIITRFFQAYILPQKFNLDKRRSHLSTLINSNQLTRDEALAEMELPSYPSLDMLQSDQAYVIKKFGLSSKEFQHLMEQKPKQYTDYANNAWLYRSPKIIKWVKTILTT